MLSKPFKNRFILPHDSKTFRWLLLTSTAIVFAATFFSSTYPDHFYAYKVNDIANENIKAPADFLIDDLEATEEKQRQVSQNVLTVYDFNDKLADQIKKRLEISFETARKELAEKKQPQTDPGKIVAGGKAKFEQLLRIPVSDGAYAILEKENFSKTIETLIHQIVSEILDNGVVADKEALLREKDKGIILSRVSTEEEEIILNLRRFYGADQAQSMVRIIGDPLLSKVDYSVKNLIVEFAQRLVAPNVTLNASKTEKRKKEARESVKPILFEVKKGEMIIREGQRVTEQHLLKLARLETAAQNSVSILMSIGAAFLGALVVMVVFLRNAESKRKGVLADNKNLLFFAAMLCTAFITARFALSLAKSIAASSTTYMPAPESIFLVIPLATFAMTVCLFMDIELTASFALILAACTGAIFENRFEIFVYAILNMTMAAYWMQHCRERKVFIKAGAKLGLFNIVLALVLNLYLENTDPTRLLIDSALAFSGGILAGILTAGLAPIIEIIFNYTTDIKLLELSNLDQPLLRQLMIEAPGTYHHSLVVGTMVEAAASEVNANPLLARVCGYYHDIGKISKPFYFIENQKDIKNPHEKLAPSMSSLVLISHVKEGVEIARKHKLGQPVIDAIQQHHGTSLITYFYEKAKRLNKEEAEKHPGKEKEVNVDDFRYPGPKPQTLEAGLVMLADMVEAAARTLESPTSARLQGLIQDLINKTFSDGQLNECELTLKDLNSIARSFNTILAGIYHHRIEYPGTTNGQKKNAGTDKQQPKKIPPSRAEDAEDSPSRLKRLGQS